MAPRLAVADRVVNLSGGSASTLSLRQLSEWCASRFGAHEVTADGAPRPFDIPWIVLDHAKATRLWGWRPQTPVMTILDEIAAHAQSHPGWLDLSAPD
jgi:CDP-paratose 2-epimerase